MTQKTQDIGMNNFTRGGDMMEKVGVGVKKDLTKISNIYARLGSAVNYHPSGLIQRSHYIREINIGKKYEGLRTIKRLNKLTERSKLEFILDKRIIRGVSRLSIQRIFDFSAGELQDAGVIDIRYEIADEDRNRGPQSEGVSCVVGCEAIWKPTGDIVELKIGQIHLMEKDFWFKMLGMDYD